MATKFLQTGDATGTVAFYSLAAGSTAVATDIVHGSHIYSINYPPNTNSYVRTPTGGVSDAGARISFYLYIVALPSATSSITRVVTSSDAQIIRLAMTSGGVLQLFEASTQIGSNGATLSTGIWYRISIAYTISSTTVNEFRVFVDGVSSITVTNATIANTVSSYTNLGNFSSNVNLNMRSSDHYIDDSSALTDTGNIWVTAKRPNANGTTNGFSTQIGAGGSGYGSGHSPQVNERPRSDTNGWSVVAVGSAVTEEYNIESISTGDIDISADTIVDYMGWVRTKALTSETINIIINGANFSQAITTGAAAYLKAAGSTTYPAGTGTDIGMQTDTTATTVSLYECGIMFAYIPSTGSSIKTVDGLAKASVKTKNGLAIASVKTINGLA